MANERVRGNDIGPTGRTVAENLARVRKGQQLSLADLSGRLKDGGRSISVSGLSKIENGERRVDVDDLVAIALALDVSPLGLLLPRGAAHDWTSITGGEGSLALIWRWAMGSDSLEYGGDDRAFAARSVPSWVDVSGSYIDPKPRPAVLELGFIDKSTGGRRVYETHRYDRPSSPDLEYRLDG